MKLFQLWLSRLTVAILALPADAQCTTASITDADGRAIEFKSTRNSTLSFRAIKEWQSWK